MAPKKRGQKIPRTGYAPNQAKVPNTGQTNIDISKRPVAGADPEDWLSKRPVWRLGDMDLDGEWGWHGINRDDAFKKVHPRLKSFESMSFSEITRNKDNGNFQVDKLSKQARDRLKAIEKEDRDSLFKLRVEGKMRLWCIRENNVLSLLWYDPDHSVYPVEKKHT